MGFNFYARSPRYILPEVAAEIVAQLPHSVCAVGVFVNEPRERVAAIARQVGVTALQFHLHDTLTAAIDKAHQRRIFRGVFF